MPKPHQDDPKESIRSTATASAVFGDGTLVEMVHRPAERRTAFAVWRKSEWRIEPSFRVDGLNRLVSYSPTNNLIRNEIVLLPSGPEEYDTEAELLADVRAFIHRYVDVSPLFETISTYYVLLSWIYDRFNELPYLRLRGDLGSGKTRFLLTVGSLCYKPVFASGASTVSPIFRILDAFRGTLIIDEGDFRLSDERAEIVKILNNGNARGFPVLRSEAMRTGEYNPRAYHVYGPKIVATRGFFEDRALESHCLTEHLGQTSLREGIPINLPPEHKEEALRLRNKLLLFRFRNLHQPTHTDNLIDRAIEPRLNQVFAPLLSIIDDPAAREEIRELARRYHRGLVAERGMDTEAQVLEIIRDMLGSPVQIDLTVKNITSWFIERHGADFQKPVTPKWIGNVIRRKLGLDTQRREGGYGVCVPDPAKLERLYARYGISGEKRDAAELNNTAGRAAVDQAWLNI